ncbi:uncharacterized protein EDB93DRAFT_1339835 [Suillus bovinus]|uniref:uncharacterized protein n=1 Tax=Suillus bovinus TaxID=48563 RepID=UPI001B869ED0|nr:uncharacterized protein EDB93DRAFT_1339835 [Suillus bovinus]KAG2134033.1 hypothetical protein EDB93DRAFT_1339835 [Suillus bovinus]
MVWFHKFDETFTTKIRRSLGIQDTDAERGSRVFAWWQVVLCHYTLWKHDVHHRDISPNNLMVYWLNGQWIGVLNDYDLSSIKRDGPRGKQVTGTVPFMVVDLLSQPVLEGKATHLYRHDAESLVYQGGKLLSNGRLLNDWHKLDAPGCWKENQPFWATFGTGRPRTAT